MFHLEDKYDRHCPANVSLGVYQTKKDGCELFNLLYEYSNIQETYLIHSWVFFNMVASVTVHVHFEMNKF